MITQFASPSVCVVDDEEADYTPIITALNQLYVSSIHILGNDVDELPPTPFKRLQLVFLDLHLTNTVGKNAASHTANVFTKIVSPETAPIVVVIWSKYAQDRVTDVDVPAEEQETEAELFKRTLLEFEPKYKGRLIFIEMEKPKPDDRPQDWTDQLKEEIDRTLEDQVAVGVLWTWDSLVRDAAMGVGEGLTAIAAASAEQQHIELKDGLKDAMQRLAKAQGEGDLSAATAPGHLVTVLTQLLMDQLDHTDTSALAGHGNWLAADPGHSAPVGFAASMNGLLLTSAAPPASLPFSPGTVYRVKNPGSFVAAFGRDLATLHDLCCRRGADTDRGRAWRSQAQPVLIEISPVCDVAQKNRVNAVLIAGFVVPAELADFRKAGDSFPHLPLLHIRWSVPNFPAQDVALIFCHRYKVTMPAGTVPYWIEPWFRLREMPTSSLRAANAGHSARVGYVLMQ